MEIKDFFNSNYMSEEFYWWKNDNRYSTDENMHTEYNATILKEAKNIGSGKVLDLGAGEGADSIRLAKLGFEVEAIEISEVGVEKIKTRAEINGVSVNAICCDMQDYIISNDYDIILCNGSLHYVEDKEKIIRNIMHHTKIGGINCISLFSTYTDIPLCHKVVPVYPDSENGVVENLYKEWGNVLCKYERNKMEISHNEMDKHNHSFIKIIKRRLK